jgi:tetratricopeptide (TPR) repeat protein
MPFALVLVRFGYVSIGQVPIWKNSESLFKNDARYAYDGHSLDQLGVIYYDEGNRDKALGYFNKAILNDVSEASYYLHRAQVIGSLGDKGSAYNDLCKVLDVFRNKEGQKAISLKAAAYYEMGKIFEGSNKKRAEVYYDSAVALGSTHAFVRKRRMAHSLEVNTTHSEAVLDLASEALKLKKYHILKVYANLLRNGKRTAVVGAKYAIHAHIGLGEYADAILISEMLLDKVEAHEKYEILQFIRKAKALRSSKIKG